VIKHALGHDAGRFAAVEALLRGVSDARAVFNDPALYVDGWTVSNCGEDFI